MNLNRATILVALGLLLIAHSVVALAQGAQADVPCRHTEAGRESDICCVDEEPIGFEELASFMEDIRTRLRLTNDTKVIFVARLGRGERSAALSWRRLRSARDFFGTAEWRSRVVLATGTRLPGLGRVDAYLCGQLVYSFPLRRGLNTFTAYP